MQARAHGALFLALVLLSACGGGGSSGGDAGGQPPAPEPTKPGPAVSGLLPAAPTPGATLLADATVLRPLVAQARWTYQGVDLPFGAGGKEIRYTNVVTQQAAGSGMQEQASNAYNDGPDTSEPVVAESGTVRQRIELELLSGLPNEVLDQIELRSPVRQDEQYTIYDRRLSDVGRDFDGDKRNDGMDVAVWVRVQGEEILDLVNRPQVRAIKTVMTVRMRPIYSSGAANAPLRDIVQTTWYLSNVGVIKRQLETPGDTQPEVRRVVTEQLLTWDGGDRGLGAGEVQAAIAPAASNLAGKVLKAPLDVVGFDSHAVVLSYVPGQTHVYGVSVTQLNPQGQVVAARSYSSMDLFGEASLTSPRLLRVGNELRLLARTNTGLSMRALRSDGQQLVSTAPVQLSRSSWYQDASGRTYNAVASDGQIWLSWLVVSETSANDSSLLLQGFDGSGVAQTPVRVLSSGVTATAQTGTSMAISGGRLLISWGTLRNEPSWRYQVVDTGAGNVLAQFDVAGAVSFSLFPKALALDGGFGLALSDPVTGLMAAARIDPANHTLQLSSGALLTGETLKTEGLAVQSASFSLASGGGPLIVGGSYTAPGAVEGGFVISQVPTGAERLSTSKLRMLTRLPATSMSITFLVPMGNRVLAVGAAGGGVDSELRTLSIWR